ncbi:torsin-1A-interacting protein 1-like isoform X2 [Ranitomeya imitator]|uniref:torsin-1A-interacting protein 1-like isoform X2 n=1 Tax=Ranitomeya imitator TaxID=111125 RepID=UPI0037E7AD1A
MSARRRAGTAGTSSPAVQRTIQLRDRTIKVVQQSSGIASPVTAPQTPERAKKDRTVEQKAESIAPKRTTKHIESDHDEDSDGSKHSDSIRRVLPERDAQSHPLSASSSSKSSQKRQPSQLTESASYTTVTTRSSLQRPPIRNSVDDIEERSQYRQTLKDQTFQTSQYREERGSWRSTDRGEESVLHQGHQSIPKETTKIQPALSKARVTHSDEATKIQHPPSEARVSYPDDEEEKRIGYQQKKETTKIQPVLSKARGVFSEDRGKESYVYQRFQSKPKETTKIQHHFTKASTSFSDDEEEKRIGYQPQKDTFYPRHVEGNKINHYPSKSDGKEVFAPTRPFICFSGRCMKFSLLALLILLVGSAAVFYLLPESFQKIASQMKLISEPQDKMDLKNQFAMLSSNFSNQSEEMWRRSRIILERQSWKENTEPAIILLAGARDAEETLRCLGTQLADVYSSSLGGGYTVISGSDYASGTSQEVKEHIDDDLSAGFQSTSRAAVLHRLELLPAGSLLILYKYCDHESAMFKNVALLLTVLLGDATLEKDISFMNLEEKVRSFLTQKLIDLNAKASHDGMDEDKFSGVWSRISHVVLPVFPEKNIMAKCAKKQN